MSEDGGMADSDRLCPSCGTPASTDGSLCGNCGMSLEGPKPGPHAVTSMTETARDPRLEPTDRPGTTGKAASSNRKVVALIVIAVLLLTGGVIGLTVGLRSTQTHGGTPLTTKPTVGGSIPADLPVAECPTTYGVSGTPPSSVASRMATSLPPDLASQLSFYSDANRSVSPVLAPKHWSCHVVVAADGGITIVVSEPGSDAGAPQTTPAIGFRGIVAHSSGACQGCAFQMVCALIPSAQRDFADNGYSCQAVRPPSETVAYTDGAQGSINRLVKIEDPPHVSGSAMPSGGTYSAIAVLSYVPSAAGRGASAAEATCVLPDPQHSLCTAILNDFDDRSWPMTPATRGPAPAPAPAPTTTTTATTTTNPTPTIIGLLQQYLASGCQGGCSQLTEPASAFTVKPDPSNAAWAQWTVHDPTIGSGYGFVQDVGGSWHVAAGPGSEHVGCPGGSANVPMQVLTDFGLSCPSG